MCPLLAAASVRTRVLLVISACTRPTRTRSAGSGLAANVRCACTSQAAKAVASRARVSLL
jgi:hypothetical protein